MLSVITQPLHKLKLHIVNYVDKNKKQANRQTDRHTDTIEQIPKTKHSEKRMNSSQQSAVSIPHHSYRYFSIKNPIMSQIKTGVK